MLVRLDAPIYGYAFRSDSYSEGLYDIDLFSSKEERDRVVEAWTGRGEIVLLELNIEERYIIQT